MDQPEHPLATFLRARLDEDEQVARGAMWSEGAGAWHAEPSPYETRGAPRRWYIEDSLDDGVVSHVDPVASDDGAVARHIARHDPARVLGEVEANRRIVDMHQGEHECRDIRTGLYPPDAHLMGKTPGESWMHYTTEHFAENEPCATLKALALSYAGHLDYREEWQL